MYKKGINYVVVLFITLSIILYGYLIINSHYTLPKVIFSLGIIFLILSIIIISFKKFTPYANPKDIVLMHRPAMLAIIGLSFINFNIAFSNIVRNEILLIFIFFNNLVYILIIYLKSFSKKANKYTDNQVLENNKKYVFTAASVISFCILIHSIFNFSDTSHLIVSSIFLSLFISTNYTKGIKKTYSIIIISISFLVLIYTLLVVFSNKDVSFSFSLFFLLTVSILIYHFLCLKKHKLMK